MGSQPVPQARRLAGDGVPSGRQESVPFQNRLSAANADRPRSRRVAAGRCGGEVRRDAQPLEHGLLLLAGLPAEGREDQQRARGGWQPHRPGGRPDGAEGGGDGGWHPHHPAPAPDPVVQVSASTQVYPPSSSLAISPVVPQRRLL